MAHGDGDIALEGDIDRVDRVVTLVEPPLMLGGAGRAIFLGHNGRARSGRQFFREQEGGTTIEANYPVGTLEGRPVCVEVGWMRLEIVDRRLGGSKFFELLTQCRCEIGTEAPDGACRRAEQAETRRLLARRERAALNGANVDLREGEQVAVLDR